jgi:hypothetical protein
MSIEQQLGIHEPQLDQIKSGFADGIRSKAALVGVVVVSSFAGANAAYAQEPGTPTGGTQAPGATEPSHNPTVASKPGQVPDGVHRGTCPYPVSSTTRFSPSCIRFLGRYGRKTTPFDNERNDLMFGTIQKFTGQKVTGKMTPELAEGIMTGSYSKISSAAPNTKGTVVTIEKKRQVAIRSINGVTKNILSVATGRESEDINVKGEEEETPTGLFKIVAIHGMGYDNGLMDHARMYSNNEVPLSRGFGLHLARRDDPVRLKGRQSLGCTRFAREDVGILKKLKRGEKVVIRELLPKGQGVVMGLRKGAQKQVSK